MTSWNERSIADFVEALAARSPAPGGGSAAATLASLGTALASMVVQYSKPKGEAGTEVEAVQDAVLGTLAELRGRLLGLIDEDVAAYEGFVRAKRSAKEGGDPAAVAAAARTAAEVPLRTARLGLDALEMLEGLRSTLNERLAADIVGAAVTLRAAIRAALASVRANLDALGPEAAPLAQRADRVESRAEELERALSEGPAPPE